MFDRSGVLIKIISLSIVTLVVLFSSANASDIMKGSLEELNGPIAQTVNGKMPDPQPMLQGAEVVDPLSPYAQNYAIESRFDPGWLSILFKGGYPQPKPDSLPNYISSYRYVKGDWTYFLSSHTVVYEILNFKELGTFKEFTATLFSSLTPADTLEVMDTGKSTWHLAIFQGPKLFEVIDLPIRSYANDVNQNNGDMIYTDLRVKENKLWAVVTTVVTGSGGFPERGYEYFCEYTDGKFQLSKVKEVEDGDKYFKWK